MTSQDMVNNPMWFKDRVNINDDFTAGFCQAVYQIRLKLSNMDEEPFEVRRYTEFMLEEFNKERDKNKQPVTAVEWLLKKMFELNIEKGLSKKQYLARRSRIERQAKEMEKEQISEAHRNGAAKITLKEYTSGEQYYNETYGQE